MNTEQLLRDTLQREADRTEHDPTPVDQVAWRAATIQRTKRTRIAATTLVAAAAVTALVMVAPAMLTPDPEPDPLKNDRVTNHDRVIDYGPQGLTVWRLGGDLHRLKGTPKPFKHLVRRQLDALWALTENDPNCKHSALVSVQRYHPRGYATITQQGVIPHAGDPDSCTQGTQEAIYARWNGQWRVILVAQEPYQCADLERYKVPRVISPVPDCYDADGNLVEYQP